MTTPETPDTSDSAPPVGHRLHASRWVRGLLWAAGVFSLILGIIGIVLPGLPTTPFVLLAGACFVRASPRAHAWLLRNPTFGPMLREWEAHRSISPRVKRFALTAMLLLGSVSLWALSAHPLLQIAIVAGILIGAIILIRLPTRHMQ